MKWIRGIAIALAAVVAALVLGLAGVIGLESLAGAQAADFTNVTYLAADGTTLHGYLAQPEGDGPFPAVLMVHEWWGMNAEITEMADRLAEQGYIVLAPDTYRGATTTLVPRAIFLRVTTPEDRVDSDMQAAYAYLASLANVDSARIGVMGFCYGGGVALRHGIQNPAVRATINLYGTTVDNPADFGALLATNGPVLGIFGAEDAQIPLARVRAFEAALQAAGIDHTVTVYDGMGHAFVNPHGIDEGGPPAQAWEQILAFFETTLKPAES